MYATASTGYSPTAVSPESITADVPSRIAFATSLASARVGSGECTMVSSICVAVITGFPRSSALRMIRFWRSGTSAGPISTPRSPRATITASVSARMSSRTSIASDFSIFAITCACEPACSSSARRSRTSAGERTKESATKSTPVSTAHSMSARSLRVSEGIGTGTPGRLTPLCELTRPPTTTAQLARPPSTSSTWSRTSPSSISTSCPGLSTSPITAGAIGSSPSFADSSATTVTLSPVWRTIGSASSPIRSFGPCRSAMSATGRPISAAISRTSQARAECSACEPCERLKRTAFTPASISARRRSRESDAGPSVATILVLRSIVMGLRVLMASARKSPPAGVHRIVTKLLLDAKELVVLRNAVAPGRRAGLDLARAERDGQVGDRCVLRLAGAVGHDRCVAVLVGEPHRLDRLRQGPDLVDLDQDRVGDAALDPLLQTRRARDEQVVADELDTVAEPVGQRPPRVPVVLRRPVLDRDDGIAVHDLRPELRHLRARLLPPLEAVDAVGEDLARRRIERDRDTLPVTRALGGLENQLDRLLARVEVRREATLVADQGREAALREQLLQRVVDLDTDPEPVGERVGAGGDDHELLQVDRVVRVRAAVDHVHHRHRQRPGVAASEMAEQRDAGVR